MLDNDDIIYVMLYASERVRHKVIEVLKREWPEEINWIADPVGEEKTVRHSNQ
jgi:hypothetical protein